jgi:hypothetical protein
MVSRNETKKSHRKGKMTLYESLTSAACLLTWISRVGDALTLSSSVSAFVSLVSTRDETEEVFRLRLLGSYRSKDRRLFRSLSPRLIPLLR